MAVHRIIKEDRHSEWQEREGGEPGKPQTFPSSPTSQPILITVTRDSEEVCGNPGHLPREKMEGGGGGGSVS